MTPPQSGPPELAWTTVTTGRRPEPAERSVRIVRVVAHVVAAAAVVVVVLGAVGSAAALMHGTLTVAD